MTIRKSVTAALGALAVSITLSAVALPAMAIEPVRCGPGASAKLPEYAKWAGLPTRFFEDGNCRIHVPPPQSLAGTNAASPSAVSGGGSVFHDHGGGSPAAPVVVPIRR